MARILMLVSQFSGASEPADPPRQLADAITALGHDVDVVALPWARPCHGVTFTQESERLRVLEVAPYARARLGKAASLVVRWALSSLRARRYAQQYFGTMTYDLVYTVSPTTALWALILWGTAGRARRSYVYVVDFFPFHQHAIGLVPGGAILRLARWAERALMRRFDTIGCMSPRNIAYLRAHYPLRPEQEVELLRLSTAIEPERRVDRTDQRQRHGLPTDKVLAIFGGQITPGRGIEQIVAVARAARQAAPELHFVLCGTGGLAYLLTEYGAGGGGNLTHIAGLPRDQYLDLAAACDIGLVVTVPIADIPTFPSKTLDYLQASLPVVAAVEADTDYRDFVEQHGFGTVVHAGDITGMLGAVTWLAKNPQARFEMRYNGRRTLSEIFDVLVAAKALLNGLSEDRSTSAIPEA